MPRVLCQLQIQLPLSSGLSLVPARTHSSATRSANSCRVLQPCATGSKHRARQRSAVQVCHPIKPDHEVAFLRPQLLLRGASHPQISLPGKVWHMYKAYSLHHAADGVSRHCTWCQTIPGLSVDSASNPKAPQCKSSKFRQHPVLWPLLASSNAVAKSSGHN